MDFNPLPTLLKFDRQLPIHNWLYPFESAECELPDPFAVFTRIEPRPRRRALYVHIPFCDTICSFCPFVRATFDGEDDLDRYVKALLREMALKHEYPAFHSAPVEAIYFGGGTPSVLRVEHFYQLGDALHRFFDLSRLKEFTMECEVKSVTPEKLKAFQEIGVNRISFGVQTFNPVYRGLFNLTATVDQIRRVAAWSNERFGHTDVDMIYGMAGQSLDDVLADVDSVNQLEVATVDYYPLSNVAAQVRLHRAFASQGLRALSATTRLSYRMFLNEYLRAQGYVPNSSYSFTRSTAATGMPRVVIQREPIFRYMDVAYGYADEHVDAYGAGALGMYGPDCVYNIANREQYARRLLSDRRQPWFKAYGGLQAAEKGIVYFPYRGVLEKSRIAWEQVHGETRAALDLSVASGLAIDRGDRYELTEAGWLSAVNYMYALMPSVAQDQLSSVIAHAYTQGRQPDDLRLYSRHRAVAPAGLAV
jgi:oxygen-independent coproporphyrinogen-3 oxidase